MKSRNVAGAAIGLCFLAMTLGWTSSAAALEVGDRAPNFRLRSSQGGEISLDQFRGKQNVVLEFYVLDYSPT